MDGIHDVHTAPQQADTHPSLIAQAYGISGSGHGQVESGMSPEEAPVRSVSEMLLSEAREYGMGLSHQPGKDGKSDNFRSTVDQSNTEASPQDGNKTTGDNGTGNQINSLSPGFDQLTPAEEHDAKSLKDFEALNNLLFPGSLSDQQFNDVASQLKAKGFPTTGPIGLLLTFGAIEIGSVFASLNKLPVDSEGMPILFPGSSSKTAAPN